MTAHELNHLFTDELFICGCGMPETAVKLVYEILKLAPLFDHRDEFEKLLSDNGAQYFILGVLTHADLLEHGGGIGGSWLTDKGKLVLSSMTELSKDDHDPDFGSIFDNDTIWQNCPKCSI